MPVRETRKDPAGSSPVETRTLGSFVCVCPPKSLELGSDGHLHRGDHVAELEAELRDVSNPGKDCQEFSYSHLPGGAIASAGCLSVATEDGVLSVLSGELTNYAYLVKKYCGCDEDCQSVAVRGLNALNEARPVSQAALLCRLYARLGAGMLAKLRGTFALVCYDSHLVRVMAARDPSGSVSLVHGRRSSSGSLVVASGLALPADCEVDVIKPGHYKYGWYSDQVKYANDSGAVSREADEAASAVARALAGIRKPASSAVRRPVAQSKATPTVPQGSLKSPKLQPSSARAQPFVPSAVARARAAAKAPHSGILKTENSDTEEEKSQPSLKLEEGPKTAATMGTIDERARSPSPDQLGAVPRHVLEALSVSLEKGSTQYKLMSSMLDSSQCALVITDATKEDGPIVYANRLFELETGYSQEEVLGRNCRFLQAPPSEARVPSFSSMSLKKSVREGQTRHIRLMNYRKDGSPVWNNLSIVPLRDPSGQVTHFIGMQKFTDLGVDALPDEDTLKVSWTPETTDKEEQKEKLPFGRSTSCGDIAGMAASGRSASNTDLQALAC